MMTYGELRRRIVIAEQRLDNARRRADTMIREANRLVGDAESDLRKLRAMHDHDAPDDRRVTEPPERQWKIVLMDGPDDGR